MANPQSEADAIFEALQHPENYCVVCGKKIGFCKHMQEKNQLYFYGMTRLASYKKVIEHRKICPKWGKDFCLDCFGGGLTVFTRNIFEELKLNLREE